MTNLAFTALIKSKGYNKQRLADVCGLSKTQMSNRINGANDWRWASRLTNLQRITRWRMCANLLPLCLPVKSTSTTCLQNSVQSLFSYGFARRCVAAAWRR